MIQFSKPKISIIVAVAKKDRAIGHGNKLLWDIPADLKFFKEKTKGHPVIMGQKTYESIGRPLPDRLNIVLSRDKKLKIQGCIIANSIKEAIDIAIAKDTKEIFFIGGGSIYAQALPIADRLYITEVEGDYIADTYFPDYSQFNKVISRQKGEENGYKFEFIILEKI